MHKNPVRLQAFNFSTSDSQLHFLRQTHVRMTIPSAADAAFVRGLERIADEGDRSGEVR